MYVFSMTLRGVSSGAFAPSDLPDSQQTLAAVSLTARPALSVPQPWVLSTFSLLQLFLIAAISSSAIAAGWKFFGRRYRRSAS